MAARERPWMKFYPADWRADPMLRVCSIGARGLWIELLSLCTKASATGICWSMANSPPTARLQLLPAST
jgi:hypothetical protein